MISYLLTVMISKLSKYIQQNSDIQLLLTQLNVDVLAVTEIWLNDISANTLKIPNYTFVYRCRETGYGGVGFFIRHTVSFQLYDPFSSNASHATFESLFISISQIKGLRPTLCTGGNL